MVRSALSLDGCRSKCISRVRERPHTELWQMDVSFSLDARRPKCVVISSCCTFLIFHTYIRGSLKLALHVSSFSHICSWQAHTQERCKRIQMHPRRSEHVRASSKCITCLAFLACLACMACFTCLPCQTCLDRDRDLH